VFSSTAAPSYLLDMDGDSVLIDCGPGSFRRLQEAGVKATDINTVCLTHLHYDHCVDFACLLLSRWDQGAGRIPELDVIGPPGTAAFTEALVGEKGAFNPDLEARTLHPMSHEVYEERGGVLPRERPHSRVTEVVGGSSVARNRWRLTATEVVHAQPYITCLAYRIEASGKSIVFGGDTAPVHGFFIWQRERGW
jgi:ribonuclease Z